jgi:Sulfatase
MSLVAASDTPPSSLDGWQAQRRRLLTFLILAGLYVAGHLVFRWLVEALFFVEDGCFGQEMPTWLEIGYHYFMTLLPVLAWGTLIFLVLTISPVLTHRSLALLLILLGMIFVEADMRWYQQARKHVSWSEIQAFWMVDGALDLGLRSSDYWNFWMFIAIHAASLVFCLFMAGPERPAIVRAVLGGPLSKTWIGKGCDAVWSGGAWFFEKIRVTRLPALLDHKIVVPVIAVLVLIDPVVVWHFCDQEETEEGYSLWRDVANTNPLRLQSLDRGVSYLASLNSEEYRDLEEANAALAEAPGAPSTRPRFCIPNRAKPEVAQDVIIIQVESLNPHVLAQTELPALQKFAAKSLRLNRHFSTGNCTHYGVLGLLHGAPVAFFRGGLEVPKPCPYLTLFNNNGYRTRALGRSILHHHRLGDYMSNWSDAAFVADNDAAVLPEFDKDMKRPEASFLFLFYHKTHYPYRHDPKIQPYMPEIDEEFNFSRPDLWRFKTEIVNRYKNTLVDFDRWFAKVLETIDLDNKKRIVVVTGDHGEELLETGRMGHCVSFNKYQTMTPCYIYIPDIPPADVNFTTSHADILPTIADALGWQSSKPDGLGRSLFQPVPYRHAVVANFEYTRPVRWAVVTDDRKAILDEAAGKQLQIVGLTDDDGRRLRYRDQPAAWSNTLDAIRQVQIEVNQGP